MAERQTYRQMGKNREARDHPCVDGQTIFNKIIWLNHLMQWIKGQLFQQTGWGEPISPSKRVNLDPYFSLHTKINSKWIKELNRRLETIKFLEENIGEILTTRDLAMISCIWHQTQRPQKQKQGRLQKTQNFCAAKETINKVKGNLHTGRKYLQTMPLMRSSYPDDRKNSTQHPNPKNLITIGKRLEYTFLQIRYTDGQWAYETMLNITNCQGNANQKHNKVSLHTRYGGYYQKKKENSAGRWGRRETGTLVHYWWEYKTVLLSKAVCRFLKKLKTASLRSSNLTVGTSPKEVKTGSQRGVCTPASRQHYSQQPRGGSNPCPLTDEWMKMIQSIHTTKGKKWKC